MLTLIPPKNQLCIVVTEGRGKAQQRWGTAGRGVSCLPPRRWVILHPSHTLQSWIHETEKSTLVLFNSHAPNLVGLLRQITASEM